MPELGTSGSVGAAGEQSPAATRCQGPLERWGIGANVLTISETYFRSSEGDSPGGRSYEQALAW